MSTTTTTTTTNDDGTPSESCYEDSLRIFRLMEDERHLSAHAMYLNVMERINEYNNNINNINNKRWKQQQRRGRSQSQQQLCRIPSTTTTGMFGRIQQQQQQQQQQRAKKFNIDDMERAIKVITERAVILNKLEERCDMFRRAKQNLDVDDDWTLAQTLFGVTTYYRREDDGSLSIKMEGKLEGTPLFDQVAVLREVDLYYKWAPFCSSSLTIAHLNTVDTVGWFVTGLPHFGLMRDACFRAMGCDSIYEDGSILLVGQGIADRPPNDDDKDDDDDGFDYLTNDPILDTLDLPEVPKAMGSGRMTIRKFQAIIHVESPMTARTRIVANIDPNLPLIPQSLIDFVMKKLCGVLLAKLQNAAKKVSKDPIYNEHACIMRREEEFYKGWLMEKFRGICTIRGWEMPPVACFELTDQQLEMAEEKFQKTKKEKQKKAVDMFHSMSDEKLDSYLERNESGEESPTMKNRNPRLRSYSADSDCISELSHVSGNSNSSSIWRGNPLKNYLKDLEEKTQERKRQAIEKARERAANRLKPKELTEDSRSRLQELRAAREKRLDGQSRAVIIPEDATKSQRKLIKSKHKKDWATMWTMHSFFTRFFLMSLLSASLLTFVHLPVAFEDYMVGHITWDWASEKRQDIVAVLFMILSALLHFSLCYVSLMYAFSSLQLGMIAGRQARKFYSHNVHLILAASTGLLICLAAAVAGWKALYRRVMWRFHCGGDVLEGTFLDDVGIVNDYVNSINQDESYCEEEFLAKSWRDDAYTTTRFLLTYSATFLVTLLFLFYLTANQARKSSLGSLPQDDSTCSDDSDASDIATTTNDPQGSSTSSSRPSSTRSAPELRRKQLSRQSPRQRDRANTFNFETIEEESQDGNDFRSLSGRVKKKLKFRKRRRRRHSNE